MVDLLKLIELKRDRVRGEWRSEDGGQLVAVSGINGWAERVRLPYLPPAEYDYLIEFTMLGGNGSIFQMCAAKNTTFSWDMGVANHTVCGFHNVNGKDAEDNNNPTKIIRADFPKLGQRNTSIVKVRNNSISSYLNGGKISDHQTDFRNLAILDQLAVGAHSLGVGVTRASARFHRIEVTEITGTGRICREMSPIEKPAAIPNNALHVSLLDISPVAQQGSPTIGIIQPPWKVLVEGKECQQFIHAYAPTSIIFPIPDKTVAFTCVGVRPVDDKGQVADGDWRYKIYIDGDLAQTVSMPEKTGNIRIESAIPRGGRLIELRTESFSGNQNCYSVWTYPEFVLLPR